MDQRLFIFAEVEIMFLDTKELMDQEIYLQLYRIVDADVDKRYVPAYFFKICRRSDGVELGDCDLRIGHNINTEFGGNIGYTIHELYRGHYYAGKACLMLFELARKHGLDTLIITCDPDNIASRKTCEYCGANLLEIVDVPQWHPMYKDGKRKTCRYEIRL
ncbi:tagatose-bisphosphate aldolase [Tissierella sp. P1]|uniref:GNAT family N-acetyltransferase n=1 Tax=Tissierella TaxID=41273 RepID=UPI000B9FCF3F|nr:GNAT family N-acetyltransferase [Tissierella sp. P1]OZV13485.1 tagatose-bisphosphate aldolase [Tissierella sp. P1]